jgi:hypothetical protein
MADEGRMFNLKLDARSAQMLEGFARLGNCSQAQAVRDALLSYAELYAAGLLAEQEVWRKLMEEVGGDAAIVIFVEADENNKPVVHLTYSWDAVPDGGPSETAPPFAAKGFVVGDKVHIYIEYDEAVARPAVAFIGDETIRVPSAHLRIGTTLSWPPKPHQALRLRLDELAREGFDPEEGADTARRYLQFLDAIKRPDKEQAEEQVEA